MTYKISEFVKFTRKHRRISRTEAIIRNKRMGADGHYICEVECGNCTHTATRAFGGWSAIGCGRCGGEIYRAETIPEVDFWYRVFGSGSADKWMVFKEIFWYVDTGKITLEKAAEIGAEYGVTKSATYGMRQRWLALRKLKKVAREWVEATDDQEAV